MNLLFLFVLIHFVSSAVAEEVKPTRPDFVLPELIIRGQLEETIRLRRDVMLLPDPLMPQSFKEVPAGDLPELLLKRLSLAPVPAPVPYVGARDLPLPPARQDQFTELSAWGGLFSHWGFNAMHSRQLERFRAFLSAEHERRAGRLGDNGRLGTRLLSDISWPLGEDASLDWTVSAWWRQAELPYASLGLPSRAERMAAWTKVSAHAVWQGWRLGGAGLVGTVAFPSEAREDVFQSGEMVVQSGAPTVGGHQWFGRAAVTADRLYGTVGAVSLEDRVALAPRLMAHAGLRMDGGALFPLIRLYWEAGEDTTVYVKAEPQRNYIPSLELYRSPFQAWPAAGLRPAGVALSLLAGVERRLSPAWRARVEGGWERTDDAVVWEDTDGDRLAEPVNAARVSRGFAEVSVDWKEPGGGWEGRLAYRVSAPDVTLPYAPAHRLWARVQAAISGWTASAEGEWQSTRETARAGGATLPPVLLLGARVEREFGAGVTGYLMGRNLLNALYEEWQFYPELPAEGWVGLKVRF